MVNLISMSERSIGEHAEERIRPSLQNILDCRDKTRYAQLRDVFVQTRLKELIKKAKPILLEAQRFGLYEGFQHPDSVIHITQDTRIPGFKVNDQEIYKQLIDEVRVHKSIPQAVQIVIDQYFNIDHRSRDAKRSERRAITYGKRKPETPLSIKEVANAHVAMCAEKSAVAQNLITFFGTRSWMVDSYASITRRDGVIDTGQHIYNIIEIPQTGLIIYDASHPFEITNENGEIIQTLPAQFPITQKQFAELQNGEPVHLQHKEERRKNNTVEIIQREYIYGGDGSVRK